MPGRGTNRVVDLAVRSPKDGQTLPFRLINHLSEGDTLSYAPVTHGKEKRPGEVSIVMVPAKRKKDQQVLLVTDPKPADKPQSWKIAETISVAAFVYGPQGLSKKKVRNFLSQDESLVAQLADYADKTAQTEALITALSNSGSSAASVNSALTGFASQYGIAVQIDKTAPIATQAQTLFATLNPQLATYNPLAASTAQRAGQTASLAAAFASLFFGSPVGLAAGGTAMLLDLHSIAFPDTQFRSSFAQTLLGNELNLCGERGSTPPRTRVAYVWANRVPNVPPPSIQISKANYIPLTQKSPVPVEVPEADWKFLQRARNWKLKNAEGNEFTIPVLKLGNEKQLELDLSKSNLPPGDYHLNGYWDWAAFAAKGDIHVRELSDFAEAKLAPASQDRLLANAGKIPVTLQDSDFEFTTNVEIRKVADEFATPETLRFLLPVGLREGPQPQMDVQINTHELDPGDYQLLIAQQDGRSHPVGIKVLPNPPRLDNLPVLANKGVDVQHYVLKGERLDGLRKLESPGASIDLGALTAANRERSITVQLKADSQPGTRFPVQAFLKDRSEPLLLQDAIQVTGPLPVIASSKLMLPADADIAMRASEFPAGYTLTGVMDVKNIAENSILQLGCAGQNSTEVAARVGEQTASSSLQQLSHDQLFLSLDTTPLRAGCSLEAVIDNGQDGKSQPIMLARIIRIPQVDSFTATADVGQNGHRIYLLSGKNLEMIEKVGWEQDGPLDVSGLPSPLPGPGQKQSLRTTLPDPPAGQAPLYVWLRGDKDGRLTTIRSPQTLPPLAMPSPGPSGASFGNASPQTVTATVPRIKGMISRI